MTRPNLVPPVLRVARRRRGRVPAPDRVRRHHPRPARPRTSPRRRPRRASRRGTCSPSSRRTGRRSRWSAGRCSASPTCWATTPCSSPATGPTSARRTELGLLQRVACSACPSLENVRLMGVRYLIVPAGVERRSRGQGRGQRRRLRPAGGVRVGAARLGRRHVDAGRPAGGRAPRRAGSRASTRRGPRTSSRIPGIASTPERDAGYRGRTARSRPRTSASRSRRPIRRLVVVRNSYDAGWSATVDGEPAPLLATDYLVAGGRGPRRDARDPAGLPRRRRRPRHGRGRRRRGSCSWRRSPAATPRWNAAPRRRRARGGAPPLPQMATSRDERQRVEQRDHEQQVPVPDDDRPVLQHAAEHRPEQVRAERDGRRADVAEPLREDQVRQEHGDERQRDRDAGSAGPDRAPGRTRAGRSTRRPSSRPARRTAAGGPGAANRRATSTAPSTASRMPANTSAFTSHVVPNRSANCTTFFVSRSRNAAPMKNRST